MAKGRRIWDRARWTQWGSCFEAIAFSVMKFQTKRDAEMSIECFPKVNIHAVSLLPVLSAPIEK